MIIDNICKKCGHEEWCHDFTEPEGERYCRANPYCHCPNFEIDETRKGEMWNYIGRVSEDKE